jgi:hypothetical protein
LRSSTSIRSTLPTRAAPPSALLRATRITDTPLVVRFLVLSAPADSCTATVDTLREQLGALLAARGANAGGAARDDDDDGNADDDVSASRAASRGQADPRRALPAKWTPWRCSSTALRSALAVAPRRGQGVGDAARGGRQARRGRSGADERRSVVAAARQCPLRRDCDVWFLAKTEWASHVDAARRARATPTRWCGGWWRATC